VINSLAVLFLLKIRESYLTDITSHQATDLLYGLLEGVASFLSACGLLINSCRGAFLLQAPL
jgi:hypothetical protein